jgi:hypothetical protein
MAPGQNAVVGRMETAFERFLGLYAELGAHRFYGWDHAEDPRNYYGPTFWSEADCALRFAMALEPEFPHNVHLEFPLVGWTLADWDKERDKRQFVDVVASDLSKFSEDDTSQERFRSRCHELFVEVKYLPAGCSKTWRHDHVRKVESVAGDAARLALHLQRGHCLVAAVLVVDDDCLFEDNAGRVSWPAEVQRLVASPRELERRGIAHKAAGQDAGAA